jgi:EmrB/QacA subfamily drug resistance transporter
MDAPPTIASDATDAPQVFTHAQIIRAVTGVLFCIFLSAMDQTVVVPAVPAIAADLNGFGQLAWIVSAYLVTSTAATPIYGKLSDIFGRRALLLPAIAIFGVSSALCALSQTLPELIAARAIQGLGGAGLMSMAQSVIADVISPRERGRYQGYMAGTWASASVSGPIIGGWMTEHLSWHWIFWINLPICAAAYVYSGRALRMLKIVRRPARIDYAGAALLTIAVAAFLTLLSWAGEGQGGLYLAGAAAASVLGTAALLLQQRLAEDPLLPPRVFANPVIVCGILVGALGSAAMLGATFLLPLFFQLARGAGEAASGAQLVPLLVVSTMGAFAGGQLARRLGKVKGIMLSGLALSTVGFALLATATAITATPVILLELSIAGLGIGVCMPNSVVVVQNACERRDIGAATGALLLLRSLGSAVGSTLVGAVLAVAFAFFLAGTKLAGQIDLGAMRGRGAEPIPPDLLATANTALANGFHIAFAVCALITLLAVAVTAVMRDVPLRSGPG